MTDKFIERAEKLLQGTKKSRADFPMTTQNKQQLLDGIKKLSGAISEAQEKKRLLRKRLKEIEVNERLLIKSRREAVRQTANERKMEKYLKDYKYISNLRRQGLTFREIGKQMNLSSTRVSQKLNRGTRILESRRAAAKPTE